MEKNKSSTMCNKVYNVEISSIDGKTKTTLSSVYSRSSWPFELTDSPVPDDTRTFQKLRELPINYENKKIGLLIGLNRPDILRPLEVIHTTKRGPYATRHMFGWAITGTTFDSGLSKITCLHVKSNEVDASLEDKFQRCFASDFIDADSSHNLLSMDDREWLKKVENSLKRLPNNQFEIGLPLRDSVQMPDNYKQAHQRIEGLRRRFVKDTSYFEEYKNFMTDMLENDYAEEVPKDKIEGQFGKVWYLTHFGVRHKQKKKLRIVFDCSLKYRGQSLNDNLLQGPDLTNSLVGVLLRFREGMFAFSADIKSMFYRVRVPENDTNLVRFLWYPEHGLNKKPTDHRIKVHVFGAKSSPSCANYALRATTKNLENQSIADSIQKNFYVDDILKTANNESELVTIAHQVVKVLNDYGFKLTNFTSNSRELLKSLPPEKLSKYLNELDIGQDDLPCEKTLGVLWNIQSDSFKFRVDIKNELSVTKRNILSVLFRIYDPLFVVCPVIITGKRIFQEACENVTGWDDELNHDLKTRWERWLVELRHLENFQIPRPFFRISNSPENFQLHVFCDGSMVAHGAVAYIRRQDQKDVDTALVMAKTRLTPLNRSTLKTVPRIELNAAKLAVILQQQIMDEITLQVDQCFFWTDSTVVLYYIKNNQSRFQRFISNRVAFIRSRTMIEQWHHVPGSENPADILSRGVGNAEEFVTDSTWKLGPNFLHQDKSTWPTDPAEQPCVDEVEFVKDTSSFVVQQNLNPCLQIIESTNDWYKLKCRVAYWVRFKLFLINKCLNNARLTVDELIYAENQIWKTLQNFHMPQVHKYLINKSTSLPRHLRKLNPFVDDDGLIRVYGRLKSSNLDYNAKHPILIDCKSPVLDVFLEYIHRKSGHFGKEYMLSQIRSTLHLVGATSLIKKILNKCIPCRKVHGKTSTQFMANLPAERLDDTLPPFSNTGTDYFGPISVSRGRGRCKEKRYGVIFTCLVSRAIHLEIAYSLDTDSFINC